MWSASDKNADGDGVVAMVPGVVTVAVECDNAGDLGDCAGDNTCWTSTLGVFVLVVFSKVDVGPC